MDKKQYNKIIIRSQDIAEKWKKITKNNDKKLKNDKKMSTT